MLTIVTNNRVTKYLANLMYINADLAAIGMYYGVYTVHHRDQLFSRPTSIQSIYLAFNDPNKLRQQHLRLHILFWLRADCSCPCPVRPNDFLKWSMLLRPISNELSIYIHMARNSVSSLPHANNHAGYGVTNGAP